jgi:hypothetical protein
VAYWNRQAERRAQSHEECYDSSGQLLPLRTLDQKRRIQHEIYHAGCRNL